MRTIKLLISLFLLSTLTNAQNIEDTLRLINRPVKKGYAFKNEKYKIPGGVPSGAITIYSEIDSVFNMKNGYVEVVSKHDDEVNVVIKSGYCYVYYFGLKETYLRIGDYIMKDKFIGLLHFSNFSNKYLLGIKIKKKTHELDRRSHLKVLYKADRR